MSCTVRELPLRLWHGNENRAAAELFCIVSILLSCFKLFPVGKCRNTQEFVFAFSHHGLDLKIESTNKVPWWI